MMEKLILLLFVVFGAFGFAFAFECVHRSYGFDGTVCVCNSTYCDNIAPLVKTHPGVITSYVTSLSGDRFHKSELHFSSTAPPGEPVVYINVDQSVKYQSIIGFGGGFTDSTGINVGHLPKEMQTRLIRDYFGDDGLEYTLGRIPIGGTDYSPRPYTYHDGFVDDDNLTKFSLQPEDFNYKIPLIHLAQQVSPHKKIRLFGSPWSPPAWIKTNNEINHGGFIIGQPGGRYYKIFARYFVKFIEEYAKQKIDIWGITVENEPGQGLNSKHTFNSLGMNSSMERDFVKLDLGPELHATGHGEVKVMIYDEALGIHDTQEFVSTVLSDKEAEKYVSGIAFHFYAFTDRAVLELLHRQFPSKFILGTEACELRAPRLGEWTMMEKYARFIIRDLNHYSAGFTDWNMALDPLGRPHWDEPNSTEYSYNSAVIVNATSQEYYKQPTFYAMGHFSKFIQPDSVRIHADVLKQQEDTPAIEVTAFERPDKATVLVILNQNSRSVQLDVHDTRNGYVRMMAKANSLQTLIWY